MVDAAAGDRRAGTRRSRRRGARRPTACHRSRSRGRRSRPPAPAPCARARPCTTRRGRDGAGRRPAGDRARGRTSSTGTPGWRSWATSSGLTPYSARQMVDRLQERRDTWRGARGRRCGGWPRPGDPWSPPPCTSARRRRRARRDRSVEWQRPSARARSHASGAAPAPAPRHARATESSQRMWIGRSWRQQPVGHRPEPGHCIGVVVGDRLVADVAARHDERPSNARQQQVVERAVRQHQPELGHGRCDGVDDPPTAARRGASTIGRRGDEMASATAHRPSRARARAAAEVGDHHGERLVVASLAPPQLTDGCRRDVASAARW